MPRYVLPAVLFFSIPLVACSPGPTDADVMKLMKAEMEAQMEAANQFGIGALTAGLMPKIDSVKVKNCEKDGSNSKLFHCDVAMKGAYMGKTFNENEWAPASFIKTEGGWVSAD